MNTTPPSHNDDDNCDENDHEGEDIDGDINICDNNDDAMMTIMTMMMRMTMRAKT